MNNYSKRFLTVSKLDTCTISVITMFTAPSGMIKAKWHESRLGPNTEVGTCLSQCSCQYVT